MVDFTVLKDEESTGNAVIYLIQAIDQHDNITHEQTFLSWDLLDAREAIIYAFLERPANVDFNNVTSWRVSAVPIDTTKAKEFTYNELCGNVKVIRERQHVFY